MSLSPTSGSFLLATPILHGSYFQDRVIFLVEHQNEGTYGLVINHSSRIPINEVFSGFKSKERTPFRFFYGGPVQEESVQILECHRSVFDDSIEISPGVWFKTIADDERIPILDLFAEPTTRIILGYSGWAPGQLEAEISRGCWEVVNPPPLDIFSRSRDDLFANPSEFKRLFALS